MVLLFKNLSKAKLQCNTVATDNLSFKRFTIHYHRAVKKRHFAVLKGTGWHSVVSWCWMVGCGPGWQWSTLVWCQMWYWIALCKIAFNATSTTAEFGIKAVTSSEEPFVLCALVHSPHPERQTKLSYSTYNSTAGWCQYKRPAKLGPGHSFGSGQGVCVEEDLAVWCWLPAAWFQKWVTNTLYALFLTFPWHNDLSVQRPCVCQIYKYKLWLVSSLHYAFKISKVFYFDKEMFQFYIWQSASLFPDWIADNLFYPLTAGVDLQLKFQFKNIDSWLTKKCFLLHFSILERLIHICNVRATSMMKSALWKDPF